MTKKGTVHAAQIAAFPEKLGYFRSTRVAGKVLLTNDAGEWLFLEEPDFAAFLRGEIGQDHPRYGDLRDRAFLRCDLDSEALAQRIRTKRAYLGNGPHLHIVVTTLRCNQACRYCHASSCDPDRTDTDMSLDVARRVVDFALQTPSPYVNFEFQGGEPTLNFDAVKFVVEYAREKNRHERKTIVHSIVTNLSSMTEEKANWLVDNDVLVCTSLDGPAEVHDYNRMLRGGGETGTHADVLRWIRYFNERYVAMGRDPELWHVDALTTTTRRTLDAWKAVVDQYLALGIRSVQLRPLNPMGRANAAWAEIGYTAEQFNEAYTQVLDHILRLNLDGVEIIEGTAAILLKKILTPYDPNYVDIRSPEGCGTGQLAYFHDGSIYPSDEARMLAALGNEDFRIGHVDGSSFRDVVGHPTVRALAVASLLDCLPMCCDCFNAPYCGVRTFHNYARTGDLFAQRPDTPKCRELMHVSRLLFERLANDGDGRIEKIFRRWIVDRPRSLDTRADRPDNIP